eukprot:4109080-Amphidinium_carterae.1
MLIAGRLVYNYGEPLGGRGALACGKMAMFPCASDTFLLPSLSTRHLAHDKSLGNVAAHVVLEQLQAVEPTASV